MTLGYCWHSSSCLQAFVGATAAANLSLFFAVWQMRHVIQHVACSTVYLLQSFFMFDTCYCLSGSNVKYFGCGSAQVQRRILKCRLLLSALHCCKVRRCWSYKNVIRDIMSNVIIYNIIQIIKVLSKLFFILKTLASVLLYCTASRGFSYHSFSQTRKPAGSQLIILAKFEGILHLLEIVVLNDKNNYFKKEGKVLTVLKFSSSSS